MTHAEVCPVCSGTGKLEIRDPYGRTATVPLYQTCHGCSGKGWVVVPSNLFKDLDNAHKQTFVTNE